MPTFRENLTLLREGVHRIGAGAALRTALYRPRRAWWQWRYRAQKQKVFGAGLPTDFFASNAALASVGGVVDVRVIEQGVALLCEHGYAALEAVTPHIIRLRMAPSEPLPPYFSYATLFEKRPTEVAIEVGDEHIILATAALRAEVRRTPFGLRLTDADGQALIGDIVEVQWRREGGSVLHQELPDWVQLYGLGERACIMACRGQHFHLTTMDPESYHLGADPLYMNIPFLIALGAGRFTGLFFDSSYSGEIDLGVNRADYLEYQTTGPELRIDFVAGPGGDDLLEHYTELTGRMNLPPLWTLGYHQSRWSYESAPIVREIAREMRARRIPCDAIHLDIDYMDGFRCFTWHPERFPDPRGLIADLHAQDFKVVAIIDPGIKVDPDYPVCADGVEKDVFCKLPDGALFHGPVWPGECYFPDFTSPRVRAWWGAWHRGLVEDGVDGFWNDMNEPAIFGGSTFPDAVQHELEGRGGDHREAHSVYGMQMVRASYEGLNQLRPGRRNWVFTRSGYAGVQRYGSSWTGDNFSSWDHLRLTPAMLLNLGMSGLSFTGADVGGFTGAPTPELYARWVSMAAFTPFYRTHTAKHTPSQEPWSFGPEVERIARKYIEWRYRLLPYLYTAFWQCSVRGLPIMRPMIFEDPHNAVYHLLDDQWLLGDHLLVAPVLLPDSEHRHVFLPRGAWRDFWTDELRVGPDDFTRPAALDVVPLYVRAGAVIPLGPVRQATAQPVDALELHLYLGEGESWFYEDDGETLDYRKGAYRLTRFELRRDRESLLLSRTIRGDFAPDYARFRIHLHGAEIVRVEVDDQPLVGAAQGFECPRDGWNAIKIIFAQS
ncbi:MAG: DUF4968 domain-containing protein [Chloroflexi bacterium]|nr:DUF4968 domain-containing protein [Chloroflexota bacterium]